MKLLVAISQSKRVVLPHLFLKYSLPIIQKSVEVDTIIGQHLYDSKAAQSVKCYYETRKMSRQHFEIVREWTKQGKFAPAESVVVTNYRGAYPSLHNWQSILTRGREYDYTLVLEDDAFLYEPSCEDWFTKVATGQLGAFERFEKQGIPLVKSAWVLFGRQFVEEVYPYFMEWKNWNCRQPIVAKGEANPKRLESALALFSKGRLVQLDNSSVARVHCNKNWEKLIPLLSKAGATVEEIKLLAIDYEIMEQEVERYL